MSDSKKPNNKWKKMAEEQTEPEKATAGDEYDQLFETEDTDLEDVKEDEVDSLTLTSREELETQLNQVEVELAAHKDKLIRVHADLKNVQSRAQRDVENAHKYGVEKFISNGLLPVLDSLERGLGGLSVEDPKLAGAREGIELTLSLFETALQSVGGVVINPAVGEVFNPGVHEAMSMQSSADASSNTILEVLQKGYQLHGRVLRAAMVVVVK